MLVISNINDSNHHTENCININVKVIQSTFGKLDNFEKSLSLIIIWGYLVIIMYKY